RNPAQNSDLVGSVPFGNSKDIDAAVDAANRALPAWKETPAPVRAAMLSKLGELIAANKSTLAFLMSREMGKTLKESEGSVQEAIDTAHFFQSEGRRLYG